MKQYTVFFLLLFNISIMFAQGSVNSCVDISLYQPQILSIQSEYVKDMEYKLHVILPSNYEASGKTYPVLYYLDAFECTGTMMESAKGLMYRNLIEQTILVGISLDVPDGKTYVNQRSRDFVPNIKDDSKISGADNFLKFIKEELIPFIDKKYPTDKTDRGLFGFSYGGLFTAWALKKEPTLFKRYGIGSPAFWREDFALVEDKDLISTIKNAKSIKILVTYGSLEVEAITKGADIFFDLISVNKNIQAKKVIFEYESHATAFPATCSKVISYLYKKE